MKKLLIIGLLPLALAACQSETRSYTPKERKAIGDLGRTLTLGGQYGFCPIGQKHVYNEYKSTYECRY